MKDQGEICWNIVEYRKISSTNPNDNLEIQRKLEVWGTEKLSNIDQYRRIINNNTCSPQLNYTDLCSDLNINETQIFDINFAQSTGALIRLPFTNFLCKYR